MLEFIGAILALWIIYIVIEYRRRQPNQIVLSESKNKIKIRHTRFYPRHLSLAISGSAYSSSMEVVAEAKGHLLLNIRIALAAAANIDNINKLIRKRVLCHP